MGTPPFRLSRFVLLSLSLSAPRRLFNGVCFTLPLSRTLYLKINAKGIALTTAAADEHPAEAASNPKGCLQTVQHKVEQRRTLKHTRCIKKLLALSFLACAPVPLPAHLLSLLPALSFYFSRKVVDNFADGAREPTKPLRS